MSGFEGYSPALVGGGDYLYSGVLLRVFAGDRDAGVSGTVVPNYQLKVGVGLGENAFYGGAEVLFSIVGGGNDGDWGCHGGMESSWRAIELEVKCFDVLCGSLQASFMVKSDVSSCWEQLIVFRTT